MHAKRRGIIIIFNRKILFLVFSLYFAKYSFGNILIAYSNIMWDNYKIIYLIKYQILYELSLFLRFNQKAQKNPKGRKCG